MNLQNQKAKQKVVNGSKVLKKALKVLHKLTQPIFPALSPPMVCSLSIPYSYVHHVIHYPTPLLILIFQPVTVSLPSTIYVTFAQTEI